MAIAYRAGATGGGGSASSVTITKPTGAVDGDILIVVLYMESTTATWNTLTGWTDIVANQQDEIPNFRLTTRWHRCSSDGADYTFNVSAGTPWITAAMGCYSGCIGSGGAIDVSAGNACSGGGAGHTPVAASITTTAANDMLVAGIANINGSAITVGTSGMTRGAQLGGVEVWYVAQAASGSSGTKTFGSLADYDHWAVNHQALFEPAVAALNVNIAFDNSTYQAAGIRVI